MSSNEQRVDNRPGVGRLAALRSDRRFPVRDGSQTPAGVPGTRLAGTAVVPPTVVPPTVVLPTVVPLAVVLTAGMVMAVAAGLVSHSATVRVDGLAQAVALAGAALATGSATFRAEGTARHGWVLLSAAIALATLGQAVASVLQIAGGTATAARSMGNLGASLALPLEMAATVFVSVGPRQRLSGAREALDGLLIASSLLFIGFFWFRPPLGARHLSSTAVAMALVRPVGDVVVTAALFLAFSLASERRRQLSLGCLGAGFLAMSITDAHYTLGVLAGTPLSVGPTGAEWAVAPLLITMATLWAGGTGDRCGDRLESALQATVPYAFLGAAVALGAYYFASGGAPSAFIRWGGLATIAVAGLGLVAHRTQLLVALSQTRAAELVLHEHRSRLYQAQRQWQLAFDHSPIGAALVTPEGTLARCNQSLADLLERAPDELQGSPFTAVVQAVDAPLLDGLFSDLAEGRRDSCVLEHDFHRRSGGILSAHIEVAAIRDETGRLQTMVAQVQDIGEQRRAEEARAYEALHDELTGLPNSVFLASQIGELLRIGRPFGVAYCNMNRLKTVNDSLGRTAGDELLRDVARRLCSSLPGRCTLGRVVGDEFMMVCLGSASVDDLQAMGAGILAALAEPFDVRGHRHALGANIGVTAAHPWHRHPDEVMREAHEAMLRSKARGRSRVEVYDPDEDNPATVADLELEDALRESLEAGAPITAYFQPIVRLADRAVVGHEALARWRHPSRGLLAPAAFLPLAEQSGLVVPLGWRMLEAGCAALDASSGPADVPPCRPGPSLGRRPTWMSVNVSASQLGRGQLVPAVVRALDAAGADPSRLHLEITESALVHPTRAVKHELSELRRMGVEIALDDFGTGYSSLSMLRDLPVSAVKIDRSFVEPLARDPGTAAIVHRLVELCRDLGIDSVAEGIETEGQAAILGRLDCTYGQGYLFGRPSQDAL